MKFRLSALLAIAFIWGLSACKKNDDAPKVVPQVETLFVNASAEPVNVYRNGSRLNTTATIDTATYTKYYLVPQGQQSYQVKKPFDIATNSIQTLFSITVPADDYYYHSLFITDENVNDAFPIIDKLDTTSKTDTCFIRFVNSSPGSGGLDFAYGNTTQFKDIPFKKAGDFTFVNTATGASASLLIALKVFNTGTSTVLATDSVQLSSGSSYTFYTVGKPGTTGFGIRMIQNL